MQPKLLPIILLVLALSAGTAGCKNKGAAAIVNGDVIKRQEVAAGVARMKASLEASGAKTKLDDKALDQLQGQVLEQLILKRIEMQEARNRKLLVSMDDAKQKLSELKKSSGNEKSFQQLLKAQNMTETEYTTLLQYQLTREALFNNVTSQVLETRQQTNEEVKNETKYQLVQSKKAAAYNEFLQSARKKADVELQ